jgi:hypothetical protein
MRFFLLGKEYLLFSDLTTKINKNMHTLSPGFEPMKLQIFIYINNKIDILISLISDFEPMKFQIFVYINNKIDILISLIFHLTPKKYYFY